MSKILWQYENLYLKQPTSMYTVQQFQYICIIYNEYIYMCPYKAFKTSRAQLWQLWIHLYAISCKYFWISCSISILWYHVDSDLLIKKFVATNKDELIERLSHVRLITIKRNYLSRIKDYIGLMLLMRDIWSTNRHEPTYITMFIAYDDIHSLSMECKSIN